MTLVSYECDPDEPSSHSMFPGRSVSISIFRCVNYLYMKLTKLFLRVCWGARVCVCESAHTVCLFVRVCMYVRVGACLFLCLRMHLYLCVCVCACACMNAWVRWIIALASVLLPSLHTFMKANTVAVHKKHLIFYSNNARSCPHCVLLLGLETPTFYMTTLAGIFVYGIFHLVILLI